MKTRATTMTTLSPCRGVGLKANVHQNTKLEPDVSFKLHPTRSKLIKNRVTEDGHSHPALSIFAHPDQNPPWGPLKGAKIAARYCLKGSVKIWGVQGRRGVGGRKPPPLKGSKHARFLAKDEGRRIWVPCSKIQILKSLPPAGGKRV